MYQAPRRRKKGGLRLALFVLFAVAAGAGIGYAGARFSLLPEKIIAAPELPAPSDAPRPERSDEDSAVSLTTVVPEPSSQPPAREGYLVKASDGQVRVFRVGADGKPSYLRTLSVDWGDLPENDRLKLEKGIYLESSAELAALTEDYAS